MLRALSDYWWLVALRGVFAILFGVLAFIWPTITLGALVLLFGAYVLVDGISAVVSAVRNRDENKRWWAVLLEGIFGIVAGVVAFVWPAMTGVVLLYIIAFWAIFTGVMEIIAAVQLRKEIEGEWLLVLSGIGSIIFGLILAFQPAVGALALIWLIAAYAVAFGVLMLFLAFRLRKARNETGESGQLSMNQA